MTEKKNHLSGETSPYLRQHVDNPVDWYPWGEEALSKARREDKPIFLSVGYSACHWCHVMAHESFENAEVAAILNADYVSIKIDREEFPDLDHFYMTVTSLMTGRGGWPNSVWLLPDGRPWYAGTYFPREDQLERMGFKSMLRRLAHIWKYDRTKVEDQANALVDAIAQNNITRPCPEVDGWTMSSWATHVHQHFLGTFDSRWGGFGDAPKFPPHSGLNMLMTSSSNATAPALSDIIQHTLDAMARGGIHDHIGGGFHRYSTDERWHLPHFEKMLYDNALLLKAYARAAKQFQRDDYRDVAIGIVHWLEREMTHPGGGFYAALDADSEGEEGLFYTWTHAELKTTISSTAFDTFCKIYQILPGGNFHDEATGRITGRNIPHRIDGASFEDIRKLEPVRTELLHRRNLRIRPGLDNKIIAAWNGLMISGLAVAAQTLNEPSLLDHAVRARAFITNHMMKDGWLARCWLDRPSAHEGLLEDYAALAVADLDLYEATRSEVYAKSAAQQLERIESLFMDNTHGEIFMTAKESAIAGVRMKDAYDQGSPSGTGLAMQAFFRAGHVMNNDKLLKTAHQIAASGYYMMHRAPAMTSSMLEGMFFSSTKRV